MRALCEMEKYYRSLPEAEILASPSLMQGMSMLCALVMDYEARSAGMANCKSLSNTAQAGRRRKAGARPPCMAGHLPAPAGREGSDGNHPRRVPAADEQRGGAAVLLRHERAAEHHERWQGLFRMEQKGRPALQDPPSPCGRTVLGRDRRGDLRTAPSPRASLKRARTSPAGCCPFSRR